MLFALEICVTKKALCIGVSTHPHPNTSKKHLLFRSLLLNLQAIQAPLLGDSHPPTLKRNSCTPRPKHSEFSVNSHNIKIFHH